MQKLLRYKRTFPFPLAKGANWCSLTSECAAYLLSQKQNILRLFRGVPCADEIYKQSVLLDSPFRSTIYAFSEKAGSPCLREIDWQRGSPYVWKTDDWDTLRKSDNLFARKFDSRDMSICQKIAGLVGGTSDD